jgi:outer membrane biosynthesis protein TonB
MRLALLCLLLAALSWPALARQDQQQTPPAQSPTTEAPPATAPPPPSQVPAQPSTPAGAQPAPATEAPPSPEKTQKESTSKKAKTSRKRKASKKKVSRHKKAAPKKPAETAADPGPRRIVVRRGGTSETGGQLEPGGPATEADHQRQSTNQLLDATGANLKRISQRNLTPDQQDMVRQITFYMEQSRSANQEGDLGRARNLAEKAHQLCDALARQ